MIAGLGIDCEEIDRWEGLSKESSSDPRHPLFSEHEHTYCSSNPYPAQHYAGRWCIKEATVKALAGICVITTRDVEVLHVPGKNPTVLVAERACLPIQLALFASVTHSEKTAAAVVIAESRQANEGGAMPHNGR